MTLAAPPTAPDDAVTSGTTGANKAGVSAAAMPAAAAAGGGTALPASTVEAAVPGSLCAELWQSVAEPGGIFSAVMAHPFLTGLTDGSLDEAAFQGYIVQGCLYLREYARALAVLASKAPCPAWTAFFGRCVEEACMEEGTFHKEFLAFFGTTVERETAATPLSPFSQLYCSFILSTVHERPFYEGLAAVLPCFVLYLEMGKALLARGSSHPLYQRFIDRFAGPEYEQLTLEVVCVMNEAAAELGDAQRQRIRHIFQQCCRMELLFFEGAFRQQRWPV